MEQNKQSAIDWLLEEWPILLAQIPPQIIDRAKEMEEIIIAEESVKAYHRGYDEAESYYRWPVSKQ